MENKQTILIVDDALINVLVLSACLEDTYNIIYTTSSRECLKLANTKPLPDLILLDIIMPEIDGHEVLRQLKINSKTRPIPVIFVTQKDLIEDEEMGLEMGAADYITKPFNLPVVQARVDTHSTLKAHSDLLKKLVSEQSAKVRKYEKEYKRLFNK